MNRFFKNCLITAVFLSLNLSAAIAQEPGQSLIKDIADKTTLSGQFFLTYQVLDKEDKFRNDFSLRRGYITIKSQLNNFISVRFTQDIIIDSEGGDAGNVEMRLKFAQIRIDNGYLPFMKNSWLEAGLIGMPFFSFEDRVNDYRVQAPMYLDRYRILPSADFGISLSGLIGGKVNSDYQKKVSSSLPGRFGSYSFGLYNGGGFYAVEMNSNKTFEGRLTLRPFGDKLPGLQASYSFVNGKGNKIEAPEFSFHHLYLTWESEWLVMAGQIHSGTGNFLGTWTDDNGEAYDNNGYSIFTEIKFVPTKLALMGRYDYHDLKSEDPLLQKTITAGVSYRFAGGSKVLLNTSNLKVNQDIIRSYEIALDLRF